MGTEKRDKLDQLIDSALAGYSDVEPLAGLEQRVIDRVRLAGKRKTAWWGWAVAVAAVAAGVIAFMPVDRKFVRQTSTSARVLQDPPPASADVKHSRGRPGGLRQAWRSAPHQQKHLALPKRDKFPTPAPLTTEEKALLQLARFHPTELEPLGELQPIEIAPIEIAPLRIDEDR